MLSIVIESSNIEVVGNTCWIDEPVGIFRESWTIEEGSGQHMTKM